MNRQKVIYILVLWFMLLSWIVYIFIYNDYQDNRIEKSVSSKHLFQEKFMERTYESFYDKRREDINIVDYRKALDNPNKYEIIDIRNIDDYNYGNIPWVRHILAWDIRFIQDIQKQIQEIATWSKQILLMDWDWDWSWEIASYYKDMFWVDIWIIKNWIKDIKDKVSRSWWFGWQRDSKLWSGWFYITFDYDNQFKILSWDELNSDFFIDLSYDMHNDIKWKQRWYNCFYNNNDPILEKSIYAPIRNMPSIEIDNLLSKIWTWSVISVCYHRQSCNFSRFLWKWVIDKWWTFDWIYILSWSNCIDIVNDPKRQFTNDYIKENQRVERWSY